MDINVLDSAMKAAQIKKLDAETAKINQEGRGVFMDQIAKEWEFLGDDFKDAESVIQHNRYGEITITDDSPFAVKLRAEAQKDASDASVAYIEAKIKEATTEEAYEAAVAEYLGAGIRNKLMQADIDLKSEQGWRIFHDVVNQYLANGMKGLDTIIKGRLSSIGKSAGKDYRMKRGDIGSLSRKGY